MYFISFAILPTPFNHTLSQVLDKQNHMPGQANQGYYYLYIGRYTLWVKHVIQKAES